MTGSPVLLLVILVAHSFLMWQRLLTYLRYFQQEGYEHVRFLRWTRLRSFGDPALWLSVLCILLAILLPGQRATAIVLLAVGAVVFWRAEEEYARA